ncbi:glucokinase [Caldalkalibacillus uzonensis]|uniref:Glucokinase n=1 Tax=Caldalkalibacillus uzonensis TaxID=353224 RepID=A0ABU0CT44_9BACI|nr:ROK family protein [Caldalkalibacillus uzonensis]MDQ0338670.1 glucokinase [Caldalkalibacillus uzonensis]
MFIIGVDLGGTLIRAGLFTEAGEMLDREERDTLAAEGPEAVISRIKEAVFHVCDRQGIDVRHDQIMGLGIGCPGPLNPYPGVVLSPPNLPGWEHIPLRDILSEAFNVPVYLNNDANAAVLGEYYYGSSKGTNNLIYMTISTGIGSGVLIDGRLLLGENGNAGEVGHMVVDVNGPVCGCGNKGCLEAIASGTGIVKRTKAKLTQTEQASPLRDIDGFTARHVFEAAKAGDPLAMEIVEETRYYLGVGIANIINLYNPQKIVFGGGVSKAGDFLLKPPLKSPDRKHCQVLVKGCSLSGPVWAAMWG